MYMYVSLLSESCRNRAIPVLLTALDALMSSHVRAEHLPVYNLTIGALGGAGFQAFEVNLSKEIFITQAMYHRRLQINCLRCTASYMGELRRNPSSPPNEHTCTGTNAVQKLNITFLRGGESFLRRTFWISYINKHINIVMSMCNIHLQMYKITQ